MSVCFSVAVCLGLCLCGCLCAYLSTHACHTCGCVSPTEAVWECEREVWFSVAVCNALCLRDRGCCVSACLCMACLCLLDPGERLLASQYSQEKPAQPGQ